MADDFNPASELRATIDDRDYAIFEELAALSESERRRILRSHRDEPFTNDQERQASDIDRRDRLDRALDGIELFELGVQIGLLDAEPKPPTRALAALFESSAFGRFLESYLYFHTRFVARRLGGEAALLPPDGNDEESDINQIPIALPYPPPVGRLRQTDGGAEVQLFLRTSQSERDGAVATALRFLDGFVAFAAEQTDYELWLRGLSDERGYQEDEARPADAVASHNRNQRFHTITSGLVEFARGKGDFYRQLEGGGRLDQWERTGRVRGSWSAHHPSTARFGVYDLYLLSRLLRIDVSPAGVVVSSGESWLRIIAANARRLQLNAEELIVCDEILHGVFDYACDLIQNAVVVGREYMDRRETADDFGTWPTTTIDWATAYDEELVEVSRQRRERRFDHFNAIEEETQVCGDEAQWSRRIRTGDHINDLVGLAFSGGGIRSATLNLGVLQRLQELDLLRHVDYLSTVSGGGYIGAWLLGNVRRTHYWLSRLTDWTQSIGHLRRYSRYLAPHAGLMSADTWTMWLSWIRNAIFIQLGAAAWLAVLLVGMRLLKSLFVADKFDQFARFPANLVLVVIIAILTSSIVRNLYRRSRSVTERAVLGWAVLPAWLGSFLTAAMLWATTESNQLYSHLLRNRWGIWKAPLSGLFISFCVVAWCSIGITRAQRASSTAWWRRVLGALCTGVVALGVVYLALCGIQWLFNNWSSNGAISASREWIAYVTGAPLVLLAVTLAILAIIGVIGPKSPDWRREWWTRFGAWLGICGVGFLTLSLTSVLGPFLVYWAEFNAPSVRWPAVVSWLATVAGGLFVGNSKHGNGDRHRQSTWAGVFDILSRVAAIAFVIGALLLTSYGLHQTLASIWPPNDGITVGGPARYWHELNALPLHAYAETLGVLLAIGVVSSWRFEINIFSLNQFYRNRLIRCYLGATRWRSGLRQPHRFTGFDLRDDLPIWMFRHQAIPNLPYRGPFPLINCSLNLGGSSDLGVQTRHSASFVLTPLRCGADRRQVGYAPTRHENDTYAGGVYLGQAVSVSGAAASPNMGYGSSPLVAFLLTLFNVRLAWWFPNPGRKLWRWDWLPFSLYYLGKEMFALADERSNFVNVSDGGHFENLGVYELVRRRCKVIIACDAECDSALAFGSLGNLVRICETDFGARIDIDVESIRRQTATDRSRAHCAVGRIRYSNNSSGYLIYLKSSLTGDEDIGVAQYQSSHSAFPHESTADQFFAEDQFESYRRLGYHIANDTFRDVEHDLDLISIAGKLIDLWVPVAAGDASFVQQAGEFTEILERFRKDPSLHPLLKELIDTTWVAGAVQAAAVVSEEERCACLELIQLMENVFLMLQLDEFWSHPDNRGWGVLFQRYARSPKFRKVWNDSRNIYGIRFGHFCEQRLGLPIDRETLRM